MASVKFFSILSIAGSTGRYLAEDGRWHGDASTAKLYATRAEAETAVRSLRPHTAGARLTITAN